MGGKVAKTIDEVYSRILREVVDLVKFQEHCKEFSEEMPQQELGRLKAFRDMGLFISAGKDWSEQ